MWILFPNRLLQAFYKRKHCAVKLHVFHPSFSASFPDLTFPPATHHIPLLSCYSFLTISIPTSIHHPLLPSILSTSISTSYSLSPFPSPSLYFLPHYIYCLTYSLPFFLSLSLPPYIHYSTSPLHYFLLLLSTTLTLDSSLFSPFYSPLSVFLHPLSLLLNASLSLIRATH